MFVDLAFLKQKMQGIIFSFMLNLFLREEGYSELAKKMNNVMEYIENNLDSNIDMSKVTQISCYSATAFQRMFSITADVTLSEYIRHRRLTLAAFELQNTDIKIIDISAKYGYESPESSTRAFHNYSWCFSFIGETKRNIFESLSTYLFLSNIKRR